jgi:hypothetical protein
MSGHLQANHSPQERCSGTLEIDVVGMDVTQPLFCPVARGFGTWPVDLFSSLGDVCQHGNMVVVHFHVPAENRQIPPLLAPAVHELASTEVGEEGRMTRQDTQVTEFTRDI